MVRLNMERTVIAIQEKKKTNNEDGPCLYLKRVKKLELRCIKEAISYQEWLLKLI